jgi:hypothetical protein
VYNFKKNISFSSGIDYTQRFIKKFYRGIFFSLFKVAYNCIFHITIIIVLIVGYIKENIEINKYQDPNNFKINAMTVVNTLIHIVNIFNLISILYYTLTKGDLLNFIFKRLQEISKHLEISYADIAAQCNYQAGKIVIILALHALLSTSAFFWYQSLTTEIILLSILPTLAYLIIFNIVESQWVLFLTAKQFLFNCINQRIQVSFII